MASTKAAAGLGAGLAGIGVFGSLWDLDDKIVERFPLLTPYMKWIEIAYIVLLGISSLLIFVIVAQHMLGLFRVALGDEGRLRSRKFQDFRCEDLKEDDLAEVMEIYGETTEGTTDLSTSKELFRKCRKGWRKVVDDKTGSLVGYFVVLPLTTRGEKALRNREFGFGSSDASKYVRGNHSKSCPAYIGMIGAKAGIPHARAFALDRLRHFIRQTDYRVVYARAATKDGLRLLRRQGFSPVFEEDKPDINVYFQKSVKA